MIAGFYNTLSIPMMSKWPMVGLFIYLALTAVAQDKTIDRHALFSEVFVMSIDSNTTIDDLLVHFNDSLHHDTLRIQLELFMTEILKYKSRSEYYTMKAHESGPTMVYNVNIHDPKAGVLLGDLRLLFRDNTDFLIDDWRYIREEDKPKEKKGGDGRSTSIAPPPPPPPKE